MSDLLIFSARMGGGHDGAANELARRAHERGHQANVVDFLNAFPRPLATAWEHFYVMQLRRWPESYENSYQMFYRYPAMWTPFVRFERALAGRRVLEWIRTSKPDVIVSTYSFATLVLGRLREENRIAVPTVAYLTDFGVHPRTVHPAIDLHLAMHPVAAEDTRQYVPGRIEAPGPAVSPAFQSTPESRREARHKLGFGGEERVVLVVSGSWGIGANLPAVVDSLTRDGRFRVVTACGRDQKLKARLDAAGAGIALGWTDELPLYMAAADVVVENAGGLTSLEAFACGVPVVSFDPIPGHGRDNVRTMVRAGVTTAPNDHRELCAAVGRLATDSPERRHQLGVVAAMFHCDPIESILGLVGARR